MKFLLNGVETERLYLRNIEESDFDLWLSFFQDPNSFSHWKCDLQEPEIECRNWYIKQFMRYENDMGGMNALVEKESGKLIGHCGLLIQQVDDEEMMEIGYSLLSDYQNKGYATEAAIKCKHHAFENNFSDVLISIISLTNHASANVARKNGMRILKQTVYHDNPVNIFHIAKKDWQKDLLKL